MAATGKALRLCAAIVLLLAGLSPGVYAQAPGGGGLPSFGGELRGATRFTGKVVCVGCSLEEAQRAQPNAAHLYQLTHKQGQVVMEVNEVSDPQWWSDVVWPPLISVRADDKLFQQLTAEENLFREVEVTGLLRNTRTFDMFRVKVGG